MAQTAPEYYIPRQSEIFRLEEKGKRVQLASRTFRICSAATKQQLAFRLLAHSPGWFLAAGALWLAVLSAVILWWPAWAWGFRVAALVAVIHALAHAVASATWLVRSGMGGWLAASVYLAVMAELSWWCWRRAWKGRLRSDGAGSQTPKG